MNINKFNKWLKEEKDGHRNFYVLIGPPAVGKSSWIKKTLGDNCVIVSKDTIIEEIIFDKYKLANKDIFKNNPDGLEVGQEHPEKKKLGKVISYKRYSRSQGKEVEEKAFENAYLAGEELNKLYEAQMEQAISSGTKNIVVDAIHMNKSTRSKTLDFVREDSNFKIIGVLFEFENYKAQIRTSAEERAKRFLNDFGAEFDRGVSPSDYEEMYLKYEPPSLSEGFDELITYNRFSSTDKELGLKEQPLSEKLVERTRKFLDEGKLSKYWERRIDARSKNAHREVGNSIDFEWGQAQQEKSKRINDRVYKLFQKDVDLTEEVLDEVENLLNTVKQKRDTYRKKVEEKKKAQFLHPKDRVSKKTLPNPYKDSKVDSKYPFSKDRTGGVAKVYKKRSKQSGGPTIAPGESFGPIGENQSNALFDSLSDVQKENFYKLIGDTEEYDILKQRQGSKRKNILKYFNLSLDDALELVKKCPILDKPIDRLVTAGTKGFIYLLNNGHILKLYQEDYSGGTDMFWYKSIKARIFGNNGNITDLPIYDEGTINLSNGDTVSYVEMARVTPLSDFMEQTQRSAEEAEADYEMCKAVISAIESKYGSRLMRFSLKKFADVFANFVQEKGITRNALNKQEFINLAKTIFLFAKTGSSLNDSHVGNIGILPQSNPSNPIFVIFDN